jgi:hypothetical protein
MKSNILLSGEIGTGKTRSLITLLPEYIDERGAVHTGAGLHPFVISIEPGIEATLGRNLCGSPSAPSPCIHYHYLKPLAVDWETMRKFTLLANTLDIDALTKMQDPARNKYTQMLDLYSICSNFTCTACGEEFGPIDKWDEDHAVALDGLTGATTIARRTICGGSPFLSLPKIGGIQGLLEGFFDLWWGGTLCTAILLAHLERETDPLTGQSRLALSTIGQKLAPRLTKKPDEVITARRTSRGYVWDTAEDDMELKTRRLPRSPNLPPDFSQLFR